MWSVGVGVGVDGGTSNDVDKGVGKGIGRDLTGSVGVCEGEGLSEYVGEGTGVCVVLRGVV